MPSGGGQALRGVIWVSLKDKDAKLRSLAEHDKSYHQNKKSDFYINEREQPNVYKKVVLEIQNYNQYVAIIEDIDDVSETKVSKDASTERAEACRKLKIFNKCLEEVDEKFHELIKTRIIGNGRIGVDYKTWDWDQFAREFNTNRSDVCECWRKYVFFVAIELGELFKVKVVREREFNKKWFNDF